MTFRSIVDTFCFCWKTGGDTTAKIGLMRLAIASSFAFRHRGLFQRMAADQKTKLYNLKFSNPASVWLRWQDFPMLLENFLYKNYQIPIAPNTSTEIVVLDIGGNSGMASLFFAQYYYPNAHFLVVEPAEKNLTVLRKNTATLRTDIVAGAIGPVNGEMELEEDCIGYNVRLKDTNYPLTHLPPRKVPIFTIDHLIAQYDIRQIDLLKIDIEGAEKEIFQFPGKWLAITKFIILEVHGDFTRQTLQGAVEPYGFSVQATRHEAVFWVVARE